MSKPLVSICCITYNHEKYIRDCIEGFFIQKTNFPVEILIFDDASEDRTQEIIREYASKHNNIITFFQEENQWSKGKYGLIDWLFPNAKGKYIALCEGDDYWIDPYKLQKQVDILEAHPEYSMCFTARNVVNKANNLIRVERYGNKLYKTKDVVDSFIPSTQTILMRNFSDLSHFLKKNNSHPSGDRLITYYCSLMGDIYYLDEITACYRESGEGVWSSFDAIAKREKRLERFREFYRILGIEKNNLNLIDRSLYEFYSRIRVEINHPIKLIKNFHKLYKKYIYNTSLILVIAVILMRISRKLRKLIKINL